jgi:hypothetical protein
MDMFVILVLVHLDVFFFHFWHLASWIDQRCKTLLSLRS